MYTMEDDIDTAEKEFEDYSYGYLIKDPSGEVMALVCTEDHAATICNALNIRAASLPKDEPTRG